MKKRTRKTKWYRRDGHGRFAKPNWTLMLIVFMWIIGTFIKVGVDALAAKLDEIPAEELPVYQVVRQVAPEPSTLPVAEPKPVIEEKPRAEVRPAPQASTGLPTDEQKKATEVACAHAWERHEAEMVAINLSRGVYMTTCYTDVLALAKHESGFRESATNLNGEKSMGPFQINLDPRLKRPYTEEQVRDFVWSVNWTIEHLHQNGYPRYRTRAIQCHQGCNAKTGYVDKVKATAVVFERIGL